MATRNEQKYETRKKAILATAEQLFFSNGYDATPVEAIIKAADISKGTFYHYFASKDELLDTLAFIRANRAFATINALVFEDDLDAISRMRHYFDMSKSWKLENRELLLAVSRVMYAPENIVMRERFFSKQLALAIPTLTRIVHQGIAEGIFSTPYPDDIAEMLFSLFNSASADFITCALSIPEHPENMNILQHKLKVFQHLFERILGAPDGSIELADPDYIRAFFGMDENDRRQKT